MNNNQEYTKKIGTYAIKICRSGTTCTIDITDTCTMESWSGLVTNESLRIYRCIKDVEPFYTFAKDSVATENFRFHIEPFSTITFHYKGDFTSEEFLVNMKPTLSVASTNSVLRAHLQEIHQKMDLLKMRSESILTASEYQDDRIQKIHQKMDLLKAESKRILTTSSISIDVFVTFMFLILGMFVGGIIVATSIKK